MSQQDDDIASNGTSVIVPRHSMIAGETQGKQLKKRYQKYQAHLEEDGMTSTVALLTKQLDRLHRQWMQGRISRSTYEREALIAVKARNAAKKQWCRVS